MILSYAVIAIFLLTGYVAAIENTEISTHNSINKKFVSLVFDDSSSMIGEKEENANYALQGLISMLSSEDELNIVKMSNPTKENEINIKNSIVKQSSINDVRKWQSKGGTPFDTVDTAKNWLSAKKDIYQSEAEYWLIIITDGQFTTYKAGNNEIYIDSYISDMNNEFKGLNFNTILLSIGNELDSYYTDAFKAPINSSVLEADSPEEIVKAMFEISSMINSGLNVQEIDAKKLSNNKVSIKLNLPIYKMNIFIQKNGLEITEIKNSKKEDVSFNKYDIKTDTKTATMNEIIMSANSNSYLNKGEYIITFNKDVDLDDTQIRIFVQAAVENVLEIYKEEANGKEIKLENIDFFSLEEDDKVIAKSKLISLIDGSPIDIKDLENLDGYYYINNQKSYGKFEDNLLVTEIIRILFILISK